MFFYMYIAPGQGQTTLCGQKSNVNGKALSLYPFVASLKKNIFWSLAFVLIKDADLGLKLATVNR